MNIHAFKFSKLFIQFSSLTYLCSMNADFQIPEPFLFNPMKHHLGFMKEFLNQNIEKNSFDMLSIRKSIRHIGTSVMDVYTGKYHIDKICNEIDIFLRSKDLKEPEKFSAWTGREVECFRVIRISDESQWTIKFHNHPRRFIHFFPARNSIHTFRIKSNTLKSALLYNIVVGKDLVTGEDLNKVRPLLGLSPVKDAIDSEAILEMIEILRS